MASIVSRGFRGRGAPDVDPARVPPGQYVTRDFPVLSAGPTPHTSLALAPEHSLAEALVRLGHDPLAIKTERFGPTGP